MCHEPPSPAPAARPLLTILLQPPNTAFSRLQCVNTFTGYNCTCGHGFISHIDRTGEEVSGRLQDETCRRLGQVLACSGVLQHKLQRSHVCESLVLEEQQWHDVNS